MKLGVEGKHDVRQEQPEKSKRPRRSPKTHSKKREKTGRGTRISRFVKIRSIRRCIKPPYKERDRTPMTGGGSHSKANLRPRGGENPLKMPKATT